MTRARCATPLEFETLVAYWLGELPEPAATVVEEHFFGCASCTRRLGELAALGSGIRAAVRHGAVRAVITRPFLEQMKRQGQSVRGVHVDNIEARLPGAQGRVAMPLADLFEIVLCRGAGLTWLVARSARDAHRARTERDRA